MSYAIIERRKHLARRKNGGRRIYRKGFRRTKRAWINDRERNTSEVLPPGWNKDKWLSRSKCPGCGSRWHRDCKGKGKAYAITRRKSKGKQKGGGKGGARGFSVFMTTMAGMIGGAQSMFCGMCCDQPVSCLNPQIDQIEHLVNFDNVFFDQSTMPVFEKQFDLDSVPDCTDPTSIAMFLNDNSYQHAEEKKSLPSESINEIFVLPTVFPAYDWDAISMRKDFCFIGFEPADNLARAAVETVHSLHKTALRSHVGHRRTTVSCR